MTNGQIDRALKEARQGISKPTAREDYIQALQKAKFAKSTLLNKKRLFTAAGTRNKLAEIDECIDWITREQEKWDNRHLKIQMEKTNEIKDLFLERVIFIFLLPVYIMGASDNEESLCQIRLSVLDNLPQRAAIALPPVE